MGRIKNYSQFMEAWDPIKKEWERTEDGQIDYRSKDQMFKHNDIFFLWDYDKKDLQILPDMDIEKNKDLKPLYVSNVDKEEANDIIGLLKDHPYSEWKKILNDKKVSYSEPSNTELNGE
jgi:hypothetical protein